MTEGENVVFKLAMRIQWFPTIQLGPKTLFFNLYNYYCLENCY